MPPEDLFSVGVLDRPSAASTTYHDVRTAPILPREVVVDPSINPARSPASKDVGRVGQPLAAAASRERAERCRMLLAEAIDCADPVRARRLRGEVAQVYLPAALSIARRYAGRGVGRADLEQLASIGLVKATHRWQPGLSENFLQFAVPTMVGEIKRYFRDHSFTVRPTRRVQELRAAVRQAQLEHWQRHGTDPTDQDLAAAVGAELTEIREARAAGGLCRPGSLDQPHLDGSTVAQTHGEIDERIEHLENRMLVSRIMQCLTERERRVVQLRFEMQWSQSQIGAEMGVSQMQISRWLRAITSKLRDVAVL